MENSVKLAERIRRSIGEFVRSTRAKVDELPESQAVTLGFLDREGDSTIARLARYRGIRHQSMRITIEDLERLNYVERRRDPEDARSFLIRLTDAGRQALVEERNHRAASIAAAIDSELASNEQAELMRLCDVLDRLTATIEP